MAALEIHKGDIGTVFEITVKDSTATVVNIAAADVLVVYFQKPDGTVVAKTGALSGAGTDGKFRYTTISGDLDVTGDWTIQGFCKDTGVYEFWTSSASFTVKPSLVADTIVRPVAIGVSAQIPKPVAV